MVSRIRIGPEGGPFVTIDEDNGTLELDAPSGDIDLQSNTLLNAVVGNLDLNSNQLQNAVLIGAVLGAALNADGQDIDNVGTLDANQVGSSGDAVTDVFVDNISSLQINNADTMTTQDLVVNGTATGPFGSDLQGCRVSLSSSQSIGTSKTKIQFDNEVYDSHNNYDTSNHEWTCPKTGIYQVVVQIHFSGGGSTDIRQAVIGSGSNSGPSNEGGLTKRAQSDSTDRLQVSTVNKYQQGQTIAGYAQNSDSNDTIDGGTFNFDSFMEVVFLGPV